MPIFRLCIIVFLLTVATSSWAIDFDIWSTGISRYDMEKIGREHDIPLAKDGVFHRNKNFNSKLIMVEGNCFYYDTQLLDHPARVRLYFSPRKGKYGQFLYEIIVSFSDVMKNRDLQPYLLQLLESKYGKESFSTNFAQRFQTWNPEVNAEVRMVYGTASLQLKYTDLKTKDFAQKLSKSTYDLPSPLKNSEASRF